MKLSTPDLLPDWPITALHFTHLQSGLSKPPQSFVDDIDFPPPAKLSPTQHALNRRRPQLPTMASRLTPFLLRSAARSVPRIARPQARAFTQSACRPSDTLQVVTFPPPDTSSIDIPDDDGEGV